jgi:hypothetical protein
MTPQIEAALIAATISLVGIVVSAFISLRTIRATKTQVILIEWLKEQREAVARIRGYASEVEELRSRCWMVLMQIELFLRGKKRDRTDRLILKRVNLREAFNNYWEKWSEVKPDITEGWRLDILRAVRHETKSLALEIHDELEIFVRMIEGDQETSELLVRARDLKLHIEGLIDKLDRLYRLICDEKDLVLVGMTSCELPQQTLKPNSSSQRIAEKPGSR